MTSGLDFLQTWYRAQCNGFWEHAYGVTIETLDNPGWRIAIDLTETPLESRTMETVRRERSDKDWIVCAVEHKRFWGNGDASKLPELLDTFARWASKPAA